MKEKTLGIIARDAFVYGAGPTTADDWDAVAAVVVAEHERRKWRPMSTCPEAGDIIAGYWDGYDWIQTMGEASTLRTFNEYTHWQHAPEAAKP